jgi:hypothetical protein
LSKSEYILGKLLILSTYVFAITAVPALCLYAMGVMLSSSASVLLYTWDLPLRIMIASAVLIIPTGALAICFSSLTTESRYAAFAWFAVWILGWAAYASLSNLSLLENDGPDWSIVSPYHVLGRVQAWVFGLHDSVSDVWLPAALLIGVTVACVPVIYLRVAAPMRV